MATNTAHLKLLKKNVTTDGNETFNIQTMLNDNWDKIDAGVKSVEDKITNIDFTDLTSKKDFTAHTGTKATTTTPGHVQLTNDISADETKAITPKAVNDVVQSVNEKIDTKADQETVSTLSATVAKKADQTTINEALAKKADQSAVNTALATKAEQTTVNAVNGKVSTLENLSLQIQNGGRLGIHCQTVYDWNNAKENGFYMNSGALNAPTTEWFVGQVIAHNEIWCEQRIVAFTSVPKNEYVRFLSSGSWTPWQRITRGDLNALQFGSKTDMVTSMNELFQYADNGKELIKNAVIGKGISIVGTPSFSQLATVIGFIRTPTIKKIIHLEVNIAASARTITVPFETINPKNSFVILNSYKYGSQKRHFTVFDSLTSNSIVVRKGGAVLDSTSRVTIIECDELRSYQTGTSTKASDTRGFTEITINPVNLNKSICLLNFTGTSDNSMYNNDFIQFKDSTTIQINGQAGSYATAEWQWQVIEFM